MPENTLPLPSTARPGASAADADAVWAVLTGMYEAYDAGDRARIDQALDPRATVWDSATDPLLLGKPDLDRIRDARPAAGEGPQETGLTAYDRTTDDFGDIAVLCYWLRVDFAPAPDGTPGRPELIRNTVILHRAGETWRIPYARSATGTRDPPGSVSGHRTSGASGDGSETRRRW
ncbi:nuclear transport factor 2 family protein [Streptomyces sp. NPDC056930]|uniref:nuclear transport factor 2 family protein n=1 Tax=Streptomyces sp. NPDC056930 TaxID=3345967 RepID=UPI003639DC9E